MWDFTFQCVLCCNPLIRSELKRGECENRNLPGDEVSTAGFNFLSDFRSHGI
jgi:hypothetical protein